MPLVHVILQSAFGENEMLTVVCALKNLKSSKKFRTDQASAGFSKNQVLI